MRKVWLTMAVVSLGLTLGWSTAAFATTPVPYNPDAIGITTSGCSTPDGSLTVNGTNFGANELVTLTLNGTTLGTIETSSTNSFSTTVTIPSSTRTGQSYTIVATGSPNGD